MNIHDSDVCIIIFPAKLLNEYDCTFFGEHGRYDIEQDFSHVHVYLLSAKKQAWPNINVMLEDTVGMSMVSYREETG